MRYNEKLSWFFKNKGLSQKKVAEILGYSPAMINRYLSGISVFDSNFVLTLVRVFPDINLEYIFKDEKTTTENILSEPTPEYNSSEDKIIDELEIIEKKIGFIREEMARKRHEK